MSEVFSAVEKAWFLWTVLGGIIGCLWKIFRLWNEIDKRIASMEQAMPELRRDVTNSVNLSLRNHEQVKELRIEMTTGQAELKSITDRVIKLEDGLIRHEESAATRHTDVLNRIERLYEWLVENMKK